MLVGRDLGLPNLVVLVVVFVIFPSIGFVIRKKLRHAAARNEEIKKLLILASEEAARAELEATEGYFFSTNTSSSIPVSAWVPPRESAWVPPTASVPLVSSLKPPYQCAVCFSPTTTRCAKCKAVRYCSGRCQIVHWRQGHKDECHPYVAVKPTKDVLKKGDDKDSNNDSLDGNFQQGSNQPESETNSFFQSTSESSYEESSIFSTTTTSRSSTETSSVSSRDSVSDNFVSVKLDPKKINNHNKSNPNSDEDTNESSYSEPFTPSSDFWSGSIHSKKSTIDELDGLEPSGYNSTHVKGVTMTSKGNPTPTSLGSQRSTDETSSSNEMLVGGLKSTRPPLKISPSVEHSTYKDSKKFGGTPIPERSNGVLTNKNFTSPALKSSKASAATHLTSSSTTTTKPVMVHEEKSKVATSSESVRSGLKTSMLKVVDQFKPSKLTRQCSPRAESETSHRYSCKGLFSYEMFVKLYNWKQVELQPFGLVNCGNR